MNVNGSDDNKIKQYDLQQIKGGFQRKALNNDAKKLSVFDAIDTDKNGILDSTEMSVFQKADTNSDNILSQGEIKQFIKDFNLKDQKIKKEDILDFLNEIGDNKNLKNVKSAVKDDKGNVTITYKDESTDVIQPDGKRINTQPCDNSINQPEIITVYDGDTKISETYINKKGTEDETQECTEYENGNAVSSIKKNSKGEIIAKYEYVNGKTSKSIVYNADGSTTETTYDTNASKEYAASAIITTDSDGNTVETHYDTSSEQEQEVITKTITTTNNGNNVETVEYENGKPKTVVVEKDNKVLNYEYDDTGSTRRLTSSVYGTDTSNPTIYTYGYDETDNKTYSLTGSNIEGKHISNVYHDGKTGKDYIVNYDGEGNTYIVVQDQETISQICHKFGMTQEEFRELNGNINLGDSMVGCEIKVKGELKANDDRLTKRLSGPDAMKAMNNRIWAQQRAEQLEARRKADLAECNRREVYQRRINNANINSFRDLALYLYGIEGVKTITPEQLQLRVNQLASLNPNIKTKADWNHANLIVNVAMSPEHIAGLKAEAQLRGISKEYPVSPKYGGLRSDGLENWGYCGNIYAIARHLYFQENFSKDIPEEQLAYRAKEIRDMNPGFFDANGNVIKEGNIKVKITENNYRYQQQVKREQQQLAAQKEAMAKAPVQLFYSVADNHSGNTSIDKWEEYFFGKNAKFPINENNIVEIMGNYEKYIKTTTSDKSIFDTICSERGADDERRIDLCNKIFSMLEKAAQKAGVKQNVITYARNKFRTSMNSEFNSAGTVNTIEMDEAANYLRNQIISAQTGGTVTGNESSQALTQLRDNYSGVSKTYDDARKEDGWTGKTGDVICGWFGCNTREDMKKMLGDEYDKVMALQNCKTEAEFNAKFREIFGVNFKPENIAAYNRLQEQYQNAAAAKAAIAELDNAIKLGNSAQSMINVIKKTMQGVSEVQKDQAIENIIQSYGTPGLDMSKEINRRNALRAYLEAQKASLQEMYNANTNGGRDSLDDILTKMNQVRQGTFGTRDIGERVARFNENMQITEMVTTAGFEILATIALQFVPGVGQAAVARLGRWGIKAVKFVRGAKSVNTGVKAASTAERAAATAKTAVTVVKGAEDASALAKTGQAAYSVISTGVATAAVDISNLKSKDFDLTTEEGRQKYEEAKKEVGKKILMNMSFAGVGAGSSVLAPRLMSTFGIESKLATEIAEEVINAAGSYGISTIAGDEYGSTDAAIDILSGIIIARIAHVKGDTSTPAPKADTSPMPKADISAASIGTPATPKTDVSGTSAVPTNTQITSNTVAQSGSHVEETISLSEIDRHTRVEQINQANLSPHSFDLVSSRQAQEQVGNYIDYLLKSVPDNLPEVPISSVKTYDDYILPDGTVISRNFAGDTGELVFDELRQTYVVPEVDNAVLFWIRDVNGVEHVLPALTPENVAKAKKLLAYMSTQEVIPREKIGEVQAQFLGKNSDTPATPKTDAPATPPAPKTDTPAPKTNNPQDNVSSPNAQQWRKVKIGDEEIEVPITKNADGSDNVDFTHGRKLNASGEYEYFDITTKDDIMLNSPSSQGAVRENPLETGVVKPDTEVKQAVMSSVKGSDEALRTADLTDESVQDRFLAMLDEEIPSSRRMPRRVRALQAVQKLINSPEYAQLDDAHKQLAKLSTMRSNLIDPYVVLDDIKIPIEMKQRLSDIETCLKSPTTAAALYKDGDFDTLMVLAKQQGLDDATISQMKEAYSAAQANGCLLVRQSHVAPESIPLKPITKDGQTYNVRVIDCTDPDVFANPEKYGLESGTTAENMQLTVHMNDGINQHPQQTIGRMRQSDNLNLSATITDGQSALYGGQQVGLFLDYDMGSVSYASNYAAGTGFCKSNTDFAQSKLSLSESSRGTFIRERFIEHINKGGFGITQEDYAAFSRQFQNKNLSRQDLIEISENGMININGKKVPLEQVEQALFDSSSDLMRISYEMRGSVVDNGFNEVNIFHPTIKGIYIRGNNADDTIEKIISPQLLEYAQKNDIPIIFQRKSA